MVSLPNIPSAPDFVTPPPSDRLHCRRIASSKGWSAVRGAGDASEPWLLARRPVDGVAPRGLTVASVDYIVRRCASVAGLTGVYAHALGHACASLAIARGMSLVAVRNLQGHARIATTSRYLHSAPFLVGVFVTA